MGYDDSLDPHTHTHMRKHTHTHTHTYIYIYIYIYRRLLLRLMYRLYLSYLLYDNQVLNIALFH